LLPINILLDGIMDPNFFLQNALANQQAGAQVKRQQMQNPRMMMQYGQQQNSSPAMANAAAQYGSPYVSAASPINNYAAAASQVNNPAYSAAAFGSVDPQLMAGMNPVFNQNMQTMMGADGAMVGNSPYNQVSQQQSQSPFNQPAYLGANGNGMTQQGMAPNAMAARYQQYANTPAQIQAQMQQLQQGAGVFKNGQQMGMSPTVSSPFMMQQQPVNVVQAQRQGIVIAYRYN
jgi:alkanesulfonate monooxygenase SsuD/methylene tetrahydromethanopterin reductase-like flavin-dependent oxidoreductase (luciferase family)